MANRNTTALKTKASIAEDHFRDLLKPTIGDAPMTREGALITSPRLMEQIRRMVSAHEVYIPSADGVDDSVHVVVNDITEGVWLGEHHGECNMHKFTRVQRLAHQHHPDVFTRPGVSLAADGRCGNVE